MIPTEGAMFQFAAVFASLYLSYFMIKVIREQN